MGKEVENWWKQANRDMLSAGNTVPYFDINIPPYTLEEKEISTVSQTVKEGIEA